MLPPQNPEDCAEASKDPSNDNWPTSVPKRGARKGIDKKTAPWHISIPMDRWGSIGLPTGTKAGRAFVPISRNSDLKKIKERARLRRIPGWKREDLPNLAFPDSTGGSAWAGAMLG